MCVLLCGSDASERMMVYVDEGFRAATNTWFIIICKSPIGWMGGY